MKHFLKAAFAVILFLLVNSIQAKPNYPLVSITNEDDLAERLAKNVTFESYAVDLAKTFSKIVSTKSQMLFTKFVKKEATLDEKMLLFKNLDFKGETEFNEFSNLLLEKSKIISNSIPEIAKLSEEKKREVLKKALLSTSKNEKFTATLNRELIYCWIEWAACVSACGFMYSGEDFWTCIGICEAFYSFCWYFAD